MRASVVSLLSLIGLAVPAVAAGDPGIDPKIEEQLARDIAAAGAGDQVEALVVMNSARGGAVNLSEVGPERVPTVLREVADASQSPVEQVVNADGDRVLNRFWIKNMLLVKARPETLNKLAARDDVARIIPNYPVTLPPEAQPVDAASGEPATWGIIKIGADRVQDELGITGRGVRVAVLDTGVDITHPDLRGKLVTDDPADPFHPGGWIEFGPDGSPARTAPHDTHYHGTHVSGTIVGGSTSGTRIGVAPGAELMVGNVIPNGSGSLAQVIAGMEWALAPFDVDARPAGRHADVLSMSLGAMTHESEYIEPVQNLRAAGVVPVIAIGNGEACGTSASPGNVYDAISVGATDSDDDVAGFSCGELVHKSVWADPPASWPDSYVTPKVSAPGVDVISAVPGGQYQALNGTSMATPHVAGTAALMREARGDLSVDEVEQALATTSFFDDRYGTQRPNPRFGAGRVNAFEAVTQVSVNSGITGVITDPTTHKPLAGVLVQTQARTVTTDDAGRFKISLSPGTYDLRLSRFGYGPVSVPVEVLADAFVEVDRTMAPTPRGRVTGTVTFAPTGITVPGAEVRVTGVPDTLTAVTNRAGRYTLDGVPEGTYQLVASAPGLRPSAAVAVTVRGHRQTGADFAVREPFPIERVSLGTDGAEGNGYSLNVNVNQDGRFVAFLSTATNLVPGDTNGFADVFVRDRQEGTLDRVSVASDGTQANGRSQGPRLSGDGRLVVFQSNASNLVPGDTNDSTDVFVHDRTTGRTERVSVSSVGTEGNSGTEFPTISADGRVVAFQSYATNLVDGDTSHIIDVFTHDLVSGKTERVSVGVDGAEPDQGSTKPTLSGDGRFVAFGSTATNLVDGDTNGYGDAFVRDRVAGTTERVSVGSDGAQANLHTANEPPVVSADGRFVAFDSRASSLVPGDVNGRTDVFVRDRAARTTTRVSVSSTGAQSPADSYGQSMSADGSVVAFHNRSRGLTDDDRNESFDVFLHDVRTGQTRRVSMPATGGDVSDDALWPSVSGDSRYVAFAGYGDSFVSGDGNRTSDLFVRDTRPPAGPRAQFAVSDLTANPEHPQPGHRVTISADVKNVGNRAGSYRAELRIDGRLAGTAVVHVWPGRSSPARFHVRIDAAGNHSIAIGPLTGTVTVR